jgi:hypothetical protein
MVEREPPKAYIRHSAAEGMIDDLGDLPSSETMLPAKKQLPRSGLNVEQITLAANLAGMRRV